jgi:lipoprotein signal peptidase
MKRELETRRSPRSIAIMIASLALLTALDLGSKEWALDNLSVPRLPSRQAAVCEPDNQGSVAYQRQPKAPRSLIEGVLNLHYAENCGAAFSMLRSAAGYAWWCSERPASAQSSRCFPCSFGAWAARCLQQPYR